ncbi:MAG: hypothetical protein MUD07_11805, partial [Burkholderiaceae bacterium]|nr:hypothetical protein [Burkholderiaceae bacterium]
MHEALVARHIDETEPVGALRTDRHVGVAEFDRDAALDFLGQTIGVATGQPLDQRCLAVIDVARSADQHEGGTLRRGALRRGTLRSLPLHQRAAHGAFRAPAGWQGTRLRPAPAGSA